MAIISEYAPPGSRGVTGISIYDIPTTDGIAPSLKIIANFLELSLFDQIKLLGNLSFCLSFFLFFCIFVPGFLLQLGAMLILIFFLRLLENNIFFRYHI